jgi:putative permease
MKRLAWVTAIVLATLMAVYVVWQFRGVVGLFVLSLAVAAAVRPLHDWLTGWGVPHRLALLLIYLILLGLMVSLIWFVSEPLLAEFQQVVDSGLVAYDRIWAQWPTGNSFQRTVVKWLPPPTNLYETIAGERGAAILTGLLGFTMGFFDILSQFAIVLILSLYWGLDKTHFERLWLSVLPAERRSRASLIWRTIETGVGAYIRSELIQSLLAGLLLGLGYWMLGLKYPTLLALGSALAWLIPWVGVIFAVIPVLLVGLSLSPGIALTAVLYTLLVFGLLQFVVEPRLFNRRQYSSLLVVLVFFALGQSFGLTGLLIAPPLAAALQILFSNLMPQTTPAAATQLSQQLTDLENRLVSVRTALNASTQPPSPQMLSLVERLERLIAQTNVSLLELELRPPPKKRRAAAPPKPGGAVTSGLSRTQEVRKAK